MVLTLTAMVVGGAVAGLAGYNFFGAAGSSARIRTGAQVQGAANLGSTNGAVRLASTGSGGAIMASGCQQIASSDSASEIPAFSCAYVVTAPQPQAIVRAAPAGQAVASVPSNEPQAYVCTPLAVASDGEGGLGIGEDCVAVNDTLDAPWVS
jgi:hypothetical protein